MYVGIEFVTLESHPTALTVKPYKTEISSTRYTFDLSIGLMFARTDYVIDFKALNERFNVEQCQLLSGIFDRILSLVN